MPIALRLREDPMPAMSLLAGLSIERVTSAATMAALQDRADAEIQARFDAGHRAYCAHMNGVPAAWGWVATTVATIGELGATFAILAGERYLWNFVTLPRSRGMGVYPRLLNAIVELEAVDADRFWVAYAPENHASGSGIRKAGFTTIAELSFDYAGHPALHALDDRAQAAARMLGIPTIEEALAQCWRCVRMGRTAEKSCKPGMCSCDYQRPQHVCVA